LEKREYQLNISRNTLFNNTLVILPTGLGKTLIASVTIYNFFRWYPKSKIIFMAPTRPLVNQQISACYDIVGIPKDETAEMTGRITKKEKRKELWNTKRVFFATAQVVAADMADGILPTNLIKLVVFDEAHKAKGDYAYCKVIKELLNVQNKFRVLALTATAGKTKDVLQIIQNLLISKIEYRSEDSIDVRPYTHKKSIEIVRVKLTVELQQIFDHIMCNFVDPMIHDLRQGNFAQAYNLSKGYLILEKKRIEENNFLSHAEKTFLKNTASSAVNFYHSLEILQRHSVHLFLKSLKDENTNRFKYFIAKDFKLMKYIREIDEKFATVSPFQVNINPVSIDFGHPKFDILKARLTDYYTNGGSKAIVFCEYRDTTSLLFTALLQLRPLVISRCLIGQGGNISQKDQLRIMKEFRDGDANTLICTCVAEEGLDIGAVDLVICFDINSKVCQISYSIAYHKFQIIAIASYFHRTQHDLFNA
jgi:Fanconi anemia group M protein